MGLNNGRNILDCENHCLYHYRIIEIVSPSEVVEHMNFTMPRKSDYHRMYFSEDKNLMFEKLMNHESFIYERELTADFLKTKEVKWRLLRRIMNRSIDISEFSCYNYLYSRGSSSSSTLSARALAPRSEGSSTR